MVKARWLQLHASGHLQRFFFNLLDFKKPLALSRWRGDKIKAHQDCYLEIIN